MKTADELDLRPEEFDALVWVRDQLRAGNLVHVKRSEHHKAGFNMERCLNVSSCSTVGCIGGWAWFRMNANEIGDSLSDSQWNDMICWLARNEEWRPGLHRLFYPDIRWGDYAALQPDLCLQALENYLESGRPNWEDVLDLSSPSKPEHSGSQLSNSERT